MFFDAVTFKDSATPFAEALVELHHEIMFYLVVIVSVVIYILMSAINISRVRESYFYANVFTSLAFVKSLFLNSFFFNIFSKFLYSVYYEKFYIWFNELLNKLFVFIISNGSIYLNYLSNAITFIKSIFFSFLSTFGFFESLVAKLMGDYSLVSKKKLLSTAEFDNNFFYKTRNSSSYLSYLSNISLYLSLIASYTDINYSSFSKNKDLFTSYFYGLSKFSNPSFSSKNLANSLDLNSLENLYSLNLIPDFHNFNSHLSSFFLTYLKNKFSLNNSVSVTNKFSLISFPNSKPIYSFLNAQAYTIHNTKLEIIWTIIPTIILIFIAVPSFILLYSLDEVINPSITLKAIGHQWYWSYEYSDYTEENSINFDSYMITENDLELGQFRLLEVDNRVVLPLNTHIRVLVTAGDVLHSWAVPSMNIKADAVPGRLNQLTLFIKRPGVYYGQCSELCGVNHAFMPIVVEAVSLWNYSNWLSSRFSESGVEFELTN